MSERKSFDLELKEVKDDGTFTMYAAIFGNVDRGGDVIEEGAFANLDEFVKDGTILLNHRQTDTPIGYPVFAGQDSTGLMVTAKFHSTPEAQAVRTIVKERLAAGKSVGASIGYTVLDSSYGTQDGASVRRLESVNVYETSLVNIAMNPVAGVLDAKSDRRRVKPMDEAEKGLIATLRRAIGLESKKGRAISAANHAALMDHTSGLSETLDQLKDQHKSVLAACKDMKDGHKEMEDRIGEMKSFLDARAPNKDDAEEEEEGEDKPKPLRKPKPKPEGEEEEGGKSAPIPARTLGERREAAARRLAATLSLDP